VLEHIRQIKELALLKKIGLGLNPNAVLLFFYINDFDSVDIARRYFRYKHYDWYMWDLDGKPEGSALEAWDFRQLLRHSALIAHLYKTYIALRERDAMENKLLRGEADPSLDEKIAEIGGYIHEFTRLPRPMASPLGSSPYRWRTKLVIDIRMNATNRN
jgi:hypothetical protein